jgi:hypothetical protein
MCRSLALLIALVASSLSACGSKTDVVAECASLQTRFFAALPAAQGCDANVAVQCQKMVASLAIGCSSPVCMVVVNDDSALMAMESQWSQLGCARIPGYGCAQGCEVFKTGVCSAQNGAFSCE